MSCRLLLDQAVKSVWLLNPNKMKRLYFFAILSCFALMSCDAVLHMSYSVENKTKGDIYLFIPNYSIQGPYETYGKSKDTVLHLKPNENVIVGRGTKIDFPWGTKNIYRENPGKCGIERINADSTIRFGCTKEEWKYKRKTSTLIIK